MEDLTEHLKRLQGVLEALLKLMTAKRALLERDCRQLERLLQPWKCTSDAKREAQETAATSESVIDSAEKEAVVGEKFKLIDEEMEKADALLKKVQKVRCTVDDNEIRKMCKLEKFDCEKPARKPSTHQIPKSEKVEMDMKSRPSAPTDKSRTQNKRPRLVGTHHKTTYTSAYSAPKVGMIHSSKAKTKSTLNTSDKPGTGANGKHLRERDVHLKGKVLPGISTGAQDRNSIDKNRNLECTDKRLTEMDADVREQVFSLQTHGSGMKVPRSLKKATNLNRQLQSKLMRCADRTGHLSERLAAYYLSLEQKEV